MSCLVSHSPSRTRKRRPYERFSMKVDLTCLFACAWFSFAALGHGLAWGQVDKSADREVLPKVPAEFEVTLFASEPLVRQPCSMAFDERGRLFVGMGPQYRNPKPDTPGDSVVLFLDTNGDGVPDTGPVAAGSTVSVFVRATLPPNGTTSAAVTATVTATSVGNGSSNTVTTRLADIGEKVIDLRNQAGLGSPGTGFQATGEAAAEYTPTAVNPGATITFPLRVTNSTGTADNYNLIVRQNNTNINTAGVATNDLPSGWTVVFREDNGTDCSSMGATITNTGTIQALSNGQIDFNQVKIIGGDIIASGSGVIRSTNTSGTNIFDGVEFTGTFTQLNDTYNRFLGSIIHNGTWNMNASVNPTDISVSGDVTLSGTGSMVMNNNTNNRFIGVASTDKLILESTRTVQGSGQIGVNQMRLTNRGDINANVSNSLTIDPTDGTEVDGITGKVVNSGTLRATSGGTLILNGGIFSNFEGVDEGLIRADGTGAGASQVRITSSTVKGGDLDVIDDGEMQFNVAILDSATSLSNSSTGILRMTASTNFTQWNGTVSNPTGGQIILANDADLRLGSTISLTNDGTITLGSTVNNTDLWISGTNTGNIVLNGSGKIIVGNHANNRIYGSASGSNADRLTNTATHTIQGGGLFGMDTMALTNEGLIDANEGTMTMDLWGTNATSPTGGHSNSGTIQAISGRPARSL